ncbi:sirtuin 6 isoform X2 [Haematobia irritans]|uniref:sirtuin 6 isoform X2 n=1 Tax=Haematobia irritans TaxID=7368 RepID=UPI003F50BE51
MSCNYADGLSAYENKGILGIPEKFDDDDEIEIKVNKLVELLESSKHVVVHTGAGISTTAGIPDFRGPKGVWTLEEKGEKPKLNISFDDAIPTITHMALKCLVAKGYVHYIISQNIDGLHLKSGLARCYLSELHGNMFIENCNKCRRQFVRSTACPTVGQKPCGGPCRRNCRGGILIDNILDWEHDLPERDLDLALMHSTLADLNITLGTTLQIIPSGNLPLKNKKYDGKLVICNLQPTKHKICEVPLSWRGIFWKIYQKIKNSTNLPNSNKSSIFGRILPTVSTVLGSCVTVRLIS